jgi:hypothetical protein
MAQERESQMMTESKNTPAFWRPAKRLSRTLFATLFALSAIAAQAPAGPLKLGDILVAEPGTSSISVIDATTGVKTLISQGGLLAPENKTVGVALALDGDIIAVNRELGLIRVNPVTGFQSVLSTGDQFRDPWAIAIDPNTGAIYVADSGYDNDRPTVNEAGRIIKVDPATGAQQLIASGSPCTVFPANAACLNTTSPGSYLSHPYGIAFDNTSSPGSLVVADMSSFDGKGAIIRLQPTPGGTQTLLWGPASADPAPLVIQQSPVGCPMGVTVEPTGNLLTSVFSFPIPPAPTVPPPAGTFYGCAPPGIYRIDLGNHVQTVVNANAPSWVPNHGYSVGDVIRTGTGTGHVHRVVTAGVSQVSAPNWSTTSGGTTFDGTVVWTNIGLGANWLIPFGMDVELGQNGHTIIVGDEGQSMVFRLAANGAYDAVQGPVATNVSNVTSVDVISFVPVGGFKTEPTRSNGQPSGALPSGTTQTLMSLSTDVIATCRYSTTADVDYSIMPNTFASTGSTTHSTTISGLADGTGYAFYVRCMDSVGRANTDDFPITFVVPTPPSQTPIAAYGFEESSGGTVQDRTGHGLTGQVTGATRIANGRFGRALSFDGVNDWVTVNSNSLLNLTTGMTLEAWVFPTIATGVRDILIKEGANDMYNLYARNAAGVSEANAYISGANRTIEGPTLALNVWTHIAGTFDGTVLRLYINGTPVSSTQVSGAIGTSSGPLRMGGNSIWGEFFRGRIDEVRIYNRALSQSEILADMGTPVVSSVPDRTAPFRFNGQPAGTLPATTTQVTMRLSTDENATCRYAGRRGIPFGLMTNAFTTTGSKAHSRSITGLTIGSTYNFYVRCRDSIGNTNTDDFLITFAVAMPFGRSSVFAGAENPLSEGGAWDSPGAWQDMAKNNGAYTTGTNAQARVVSPVIGPDQFAAITFDQDPGTGSWVGVTTRTQSAQNGGGYLAIAYAGEVRLYRTTDAGSLTFTLLASTPVNLGVAPRHLRMESQGNTHRVYFNGVQVINHTATGTVYQSGQPGIAASTFGGPQVRILWFEGGDIGLPDTTAPFRSNGQPLGTLPWDTVQTTLSLTTSEDATCRYSTQPGVTYASMPFTFATTGSLLHTRTLTGLSSGNTYTFYVRCVDLAKNANANDFTITFNVAVHSTATSSFSGVESPLSENGMWDSPGAWADLAKNNGAFANGLNAMARLVTPTVAPDQYAEINFDQDPGAASWVGVMTRVQGPDNGSGYLAIVYAGEVQLYRADDSGSLNFTLLASAPVNVGAATRHLRLESRANNHRVYFNGTLLVDHNATGPLYAIGQPGIAASVFGGPQVKILSFGGGVLGTP